MTATDQIGETPAAAQDRVQRQLDRLERLGGLGMGLAEEIAKRASAPPEQGQVSADELCSLSLAYTRVSRAVRQIIALEQEAMGCARCATGPGR